MSRGGIPPHPGPLPQGEGGPQQQRFMVLMMTFWTLIRRSLRFHARAHLGVVLGAAIGSAALIGALVVGDSVKGSLRERALARVGRADYLLASRDRLFSDSTNTCARAFGNSYAQGVDL